MISSYNGCRVVSVNKTYKNRRELTSVFFNVSYSDWCGSLTDNDKLSLFYTFGPQLNTVGDLGHRIINLK